MPVVRHRTVLPQWSILPCFELCTARTGHSANVGTRLAMQCKQSTNSKSKVTMNTSTGPVHESGSKVAATVESLQSPINLWLVDDNHGMRATLKELLGREAGINCTGSFASPNHVLSALASKVGPDVLLLDVHMGEMNGLDTIRPIKSLSRSTRVLMLTTFFDSESESRAMSDGASGFLLKTFPVGKILAAIRQACDRPSPHPKRVRLLGQASCPVQASNIQVRMASRTMPAPGDRSSTTTKRSLWLEHCLELLRGIRR